MDPLATTHTSTPSDLTSPYVDTTVSPYTLLHRGRLDPIIHPACFHIEEKHIHYLSDTFQRFVCSVDLSHITKLGTTILIPDADQTWPKESQVHELFTMTQLQPRPFDEGSVSFHGEVVACWAYEHTPPLSQSAPQTWLTFLRQKYRTLFKNSSVQRDRMLSFPFTSLRMTSSLRHTFFPLYMHSRSSTKSPLLHHTLSPSPFLSPINLLHNPSTRTFATGPRSSLHIKTTTRSPHPLCSYNFNTIKLPHFNLFYTHLSALHPLATHYNSTSSFNLPSFTSYGQPPTVLSTTKRLLTCFALLSTSLTGLTT